MAADADSPSLLVLLDLTAALDTVDHNILLHNLRHTIILSGSVYNWFSSYFTGRMEYVALGKAKSLTHNVTCGVPQSSDPPCLYYICPPSVMSSVSMEYHCIAMLTTLNFTLRPILFPF